MARHLIVGDGTAYGVTSGLVNDGAVSVQKMSSSGPTELVLGDTPANAPQIRIIGGGSDGKDIVTPWIYGKDVVNWSGKSNVAAVSQSSTIVGTANATNTSNVEVTIKLVNTSNGQNFGDSKSYTVITNSTAINTIEEIGDNFTGAMYSGYSISGSAALSATNSADLPWFVKSVTWDGSTIITLIGWDKGETMTNGQVAEYPTTFNIVIENGDAAANGGTYTIAAPNQSATGTLALRGYGDGYYVKQMEEDLRGAQYGYYNRVQLPVTPTQTAVVGDTYDMYNIAATKDGSSSSQIHGVDNIIELNIAWDDTTAAIQQAFEGVLNPYFASAGFANVSL